MKSLTVLALLGCFVVAIGLPQRQWVHVCEKNSCRLPDCQCSETQWKETASKPQFVVLSFDDAVSEASYNDFIEPTFVGRKNLDGCPISGTFFVPHEYSNYSVVNRLYGLGFEIGSHSITKNFNQQYWRDASLETLLAEFDGQRTILSTFANISSSDIIGARIPQLQINNNTFRALRQAGFQYDASWPAQQPWTFFPYTLDFTSRQQCHTQECQVESTPGLWEMPIIDWKDENGTSCNSIQACAVEKNIYKWMIENFNQIKKSGAPISLRLSYSWFLSSSLHGIELNKFLNYLSTQENTYIVSYKQLLEWSRNPTETFSSCQKISTPECNRGPFDCSYSPTWGSDCINFNHYLGVCGKCPMTYPWLNNPLGNGKCFN